LIKKGIYIVTIYLCIHLFMYLFVHLVLHAFMHFFVHAFIYLRVFFVYSFILTIFHIFYDTKSIKTMKYTYTFYFCFLKVQCVNKLSIY